MTSPWTYREHFGVSPCYGEGFDNYHHTFPYDYSTSEWGGSYNLTTVFIEAMAAIGQAYDLRRATPETIKARVARTGIPELTAHSIKGEIIKEL